MSTTPEPRPIAQPPPLEDDPKLPMLQMDWIRLSTLVVLTVDTVIVILLSWFLVSAAQGQREVNECYQQTVDSIVAYVNAASPANKSDRQAQRELLVSQLAAGGNSRESIERYLRQLDEADRTRSTAAIPAARCAR